MKRKKQCFVLLVLLVLSFCSYAQESESQEQSFTIQDIQALKEVFRLILMNASASELDQKKLDNLFMNWENVINQLPSQQEKVLKLSKENSKLKINIVLLGALSVVELVALGFLIFR